MSYRPSAAPTFWIFCAYPTALALALATGGCSGGDGADIVTPAGSANADTGVLPDSGLRDSAGSPSGELMTAEAAANDARSSRVDAGSSVPEMPSEAAPHDAGRVPQDAGSTMLPPKDASLDARAPSVDAGSQSDAAVSDEDLQFCVDENNRYRATLAVAPLARSSKLEQFATIGAQVDYAAQTAHTHFTTSKGVPGAQRSAENEIPGFGGWSLRRQKTLHAIITQGLAAMWAEGPGGGHYDNMKDAALHNVGCGVFIANNAEQDVTVTIDFTN